MAGGDDHATRIALLEQAEKNMDKRVSSLEGNFKWVALIIIGTVLASGLKSLGLV